MKKINLFIFIISVSISITVFERSQAQFQISRSVFGTAGGIMSNPDNSMNTTLGQVGIGESQNSSNRIQFGFWYSQQFLVGIEDLNSLLPTRFELFQNYPNPFNPTTKIKYAIPRQSRVVIEVYNILGQRVSTLVNGEKAPGYYTIDFNASSLGSGFYIYRIETSEFTDIKKMMLIK
jgi:hypothetical protein